MMPAFIGRMCVCVDGSSGLWHILLWVTAGDARLFLCAVRFISSRLVFTHKVKSVSRIMKLSSHSRAIDSSKLCAIIVVEAVITQTGAFHFSFSIFESSCK